VTWGIISPNSVRRLHTSDANEENEKGTRISLNFLVIGTTPSHFDPRNYLDYIPEPTMTTAIDLSGKSQQQMLFIPDTMASWPYERAFNRHYDEAVAESRAWFSRYTHFTKQFDFHDHLERCDCGAF